MDLDSVAESRSDPVMKKSVPFRKLGKFNSCKPSKPVSHNSKVSVSAPSFSIPVQRIRAPFHRFRVGSMAQGLSARGFDDRAINLINNDNKLSTRHQYQGVWSKFLQYLKQHNISQAEINEGVVAIFLAYHAFVYERAYSIIAV